MLIDRLRDMTLLTLVQVENFLIGAVCGLLIGPRNQDIKYSVREITQNLVKTYVTIWITMTVIDPLLQDALSHPLM